MKDIFGSNAQIAGAWHIDEAVFTIEGGADVIAMGIGFEFGRSVVPYQPVNQAGRYLIAGRGAGSLTVNLLVGPSKNIKAFFEQYADVCNAAKNTLLLKPGGVKDCGNNSSTIEFVLSGIVLSTIKVSVEDLNGISVVSSGLTMVLNGLSIK